MNQPDAGIPPVFCLKADQFKLGMTVNIRGGIGPSMVVVKLPDDNATVHCLFWDTTTNSPKTVIVPSVALWFDYPNAKNPRALPINSMREAPRPPLLREKEAGIVDGK
jgi:hypothetical protein